MIVAFVPGGGTDIIGRLAARGISEVVHANVIVENRAGGGGAVGTGLVAKSAPDGYTLITGGTGAHAINPWLYANLPYKSPDNFAPISLVATSPYLMLVSKDLPVKTVQDFIALAKKKPGSIAMASSGNGGMPHLAGELFQMMTGTKLLHVPYRGTGDVFPDLISGRVQVTFADIASAYPQIKAGNVRVLAITSAQRSSSYPDIPTVAESGVPGYEAVGWFATFAPAGTAKPVIDKLSQAIRTFITRPDVRQNLQTMGAEPIGSTPEELDKVVKADLVRWGKVVKEADVHVE
jgi:tripartite-type tricarboxylate transporter receptor subunit TctC